MSYKVVDDHDPADTEGVVRVAALGDIHAAVDSPGVHRDQVAEVAAKADMLLISGDLTCIGDPAEAAALADELRDASFPVVAVLGNHDHHSDRPDAVAKELEAAGVHVLEGEGIALEIDGVRVGIAGTKGFGGGFRGAHGSDFGEPEMKAFVGHTKMLADRLERSLDALDVDLRIALLHYSPIEATLEGERLEIYPFLGSYLLAEAIDNTGADLVLHGHAHNGTEKGRTAAGIPVRNVAQPVIRHAYNVYTLSASRQVTQAAASSF